MLSLLCELEVLVALDAACADLDTATTCCFWKCDPLEVGVLAGVTRGVEFCRADTIRITSCHAASLRTDDANI